MRLAILGATGSIGSHLVDRALQQGHSVHVLARNAAFSWVAAGGPAAAPALVVTQGDALDRAAVTTVIDGSDAVLSALGPRGDKTPGLLTGAVAAITEAMRKTGTRRLICVAARSPGPTWLASWTLR